MSHRCTQRLEKDKLIRRVKMTWAGTPDWFYSYDSSKRPDQIQHRLGKAWIYTAWNLKVIASEGNQELIHFKSEERRFFNEDKSYPIPDSYAVIEHQFLGKLFYFGEFQITESGNKWDKDYKALFESFREDDIIVLTVVTTGDYAPIKERLKKELSPMKNVHLEFYTLDKLRELCWRVALQLREKSKQKEALTS